MKNKLGNDLRLEISIGVLLILIGLVFILNDFIVLKREEVFTKMNLELNDLLVQAEEKISIDTRDSDLILEEARREALNSIDYESFVGKLTIPKINFVRGFYKKESSLNDVKTNIKILNESSYPDDIKGNVIIIGHSGNYSNSYFGELYKLVKGDEAIISFSGKEYSYKVIDIYNEVKDGTITIYRDTGKSTLTLITCTKDDDSSQTVYIFELVNIK